MPMNRRSTDYFTPGWWRDYKRIFTQVTEAYRAKVANGEPDPLPSEPRPGRFPWRQPYGVFVKDLKRVGFDYATSKALAREIAFQLGHDGAGQGSVLGVQGKMAQIPGATRPRS